MCLAFLYARFLLRILHLIVAVSQGGSNGLMRTCLFGIHSAASDKMQELILLAYTVELRWLELVGTVGTSSTHPCVRAIPSLTIFQVGSCVLYVITDTTFFIDQSCKAHVTPITDQ